MSTATSLIQLAPSGIRASIALHEYTGRAVFVWGSPGLAKSATGAAVATNRNVAFVDVRLSMYAPTDVHGMPYRVEENGVTTGVAFTPPKILPRNIDEDKVRPLQAVPTVISFASLNPVGSNGIHYVKSPVITVEALEDGLTAEIVSQTLERFIVRLVDQNGNIAAGNVHYTIKGDAEAIVAFEELNSAPLSTQQAAYQFILDRRVGEYIVPKGVQLIAMGNLQTDKGLTYTQPLPLANRFVHLEMKMVFDEWQEWALSALVHPMVVGYLSNNKGALHQFNPSSASRGFQTPRSWEFVSDILKGAEESARRGVPIPASILAANICGAIGEGEGTKFREFMKVHDKLPNISDVMDGSVTSLDQKHKGNAAVGFSLVTSLCYQLRHEHLELVDAGIAGNSDKNERVNWAKRFNNVLVFWMDNMQPEICVMAMKAVMSIHNLPLANRKHIPAVTDFSRRFGDLISK
jgi:MoxR-like ATPase